MVYWEKVIVISVLSAVAEEARGLWEARWWHLTQFWSGGLQGRLPGGGYIDKQRRGRKAFGAERTAWTKAWR